MLTPCSHDYSCRSNLTIDWTPLSLPQWRDMFARGVRAPLTQGYDYARAMAATSAYRPRWGVIRDVQGDAVGVVQILGVTLPGGPVPVVSLERGPVWFMPNPSRDDWAAFLRALARDYPPGWFRVRRIMPECAGGLLAVDDMRVMGYRLRPRLHPYQTMWVDAPDGVGQARSRLASNWRNHLNQAERQADVAIHHHTTLAGAMPLLRAIIIDQARRGYPGPDARLLHALAQSHAGGDGILATTAAIDGKLEAGALFLRHGSCATWQAGMVFPHGRQKCANYRVVFDGLDTLFKSGVASVDLGGYNDQTIGIRQFKHGLGGQHVTLLGTVS